jgi:hypothetical protein
VAGEEGDISSAAEKEEVTILAELVHAPVSRTQSQPSASVNNITADLTEEATRESDPETEVVSCMLVLSFMSGQNVLNVSTECSVLKCCLF